MKKTLIASLLALASISSFATPAGDLADSVKEDASTYSLARTIHSINPRQSYSTIESIVKNSVYICAYTSYDKGVDAYKSCLNAKLDPVVALMRK